MKTIKHEASIEQPHYHVTAGLIRNNGKVLISQRPLEKMFGGLWEFPGGKLQDGETLEQCLVREIKEELNIEIRILEKLVSIIHCDDHLQITLHVFLCDFLGGELECREAHDFKWVDFSELNDYELTRPDQAVVKKLRANKQFFLTNE